MNTPIVMFAYNRPSTTQKVVDAISRQTIVPKEIIVFIDNIKRDEDRSNYEEVVAIFNNITWAQTQIIKRPTNFGCANNVITGLNQVFRISDRAIIVEDDILVAPTFYESMCLLLDYYYLRKNVFSVGGYPSILPNSLKNISDDVFLSPRFSSWGWGTWADRWEELQLSNWNNPYSIITDIPLTAGNDLRVMAEELEKKPDFYWDIKIALTNVYKNYVHALTKYYLVNNIGLNSGDHPNHELDITKFSQKFNPIENRLPKNISTTITTEVKKNIHQEYIDAVERFNKKSGTLLHFFKQLIKKHLRC